MGWGRSAPRPAAAAAGPRWLTPPLTYCVTPGGCSGAGWGRDGLGAGRARVLFNKDEVKHAGQKQQQQQSKKHTQRKLGWPNRVMKLM